MYLNLQDQAIFVADSHYNLLNNQFLIFLEKLKNKEIQTTQLILMGDNFDFLSGESKYFIKQNKILIDIINDLSQTIDIIYLEGNHDYNLSSLFPNVNVVKRENQPVVLKYKEKTVAISHGDNFINWQYDLYCRIIRNTIFLKFLNIIDFNNYISKKIDESLLKKNICHKMDTFKSMVTKRINNYKTDIIIEGHYHQGDIFDIGNKLYVNIPSLCCSNRYVRLENYNFKGENI
jgi:UDP-2,3-diacylglucosamine hydrolase